MFVRKDLKPSHDLYVAACRNYRKIEKSDEGRVKAPVLVLITKGNPPRESYVTFFADYADIGKVGDTFCDIFLIKSRKPMRFKHSLGRVLVK